MRSYVSFFQWPDRARAELGIVEKMLETLAARNERVLAAPESYKPDPPDCICRNEAGELVAVEVTEVVCVEAVRQNQKGKEVFRNWRPGELQEHISIQLGEKDRKTYHGGPYAEVIVCLFTDEMLLTIERIQQELAGSTFGPFEQITSAFILVSYDASIKGYPVHTLKLKKVA